MENGELTEIRVKINADCEGAKNVFIKQGLTPGFTFLTTYPDTIYASINSSANEFHVAGTVYSPKSGETSVTLPIPYITITGGLDATSANFTLSKSKVTTSKVGTGEETDNIIEWEIWRQFGWQNPTLDGDYSTKTGFAVNAYYQHSDEMKSNESHIETFSVSGSLRYECVLVSGSSTINQHLKASNMLINGSIKIIGG